MQRNLLLQLMIVFALVQGLGLSIGYAFIEAQEQGLIEKTSVVNDNPDDNINALALFAQIIVMTGALLLVIKFLPKHKKWILRALEIVATTTSLLIVLGFFLPPTFALVLTLGVLGLRLAQPDDVLLRNAVALCAASVVGALVGVLLGTTPILLFIIALALYDLWAVFGSRHMVEIAQNVAPQNLAFTIAMPTKEHQFELGTGDLVVPLAFATSTLSTTMPYGWPNALLLPAGILVASLLGLIVTLDIVGKKIGRALPALPLQTLFMVGVYTVVLWFPY